MHKIIRKVSLILCVLTLTLVAVGCTGTQKPVDENKVDANEIVKEDVYSNVLSSYFPTVEGTVLNYSGSYEYGHTLTLSTVDEKDDKLMLDFKGEIIDVSDGEGAPREERLFQTQYVITKDEVKEIQKNINRRHSQSIIREQVVLKLPLEVKKLWKQNVTIDGKEYKAETKIIDIAKDDKGRKYVRTETVVKGLKGYPDDTYKEIRDFKEGKGLSQFSTVILLEGEDPENPTTLDFGYTLYEAE